jgi:hypothetical protein
MIPRVVLALTALLLWAAVCAACPPGMRGGFRASWDYDGGWGVPPAAWQWRAPPPPGAWEMSGPPMWAGQQQFNRQRFTFQQRAGLFGRRSTRFDFDSSLQFNGGGWQRPAVFGNGGGGGGGAMPGRAGGGNGHH